MAIQYQAENKRPAGALKLPEAALQSAMSSPGMEHCCDGAQECVELGLRHFTGRHLEFAMADLAAAHDVAKHWNVEWRVREHHAGPLVAQEPLIAGQIPRIRAEQPVVASRNMSWARNRGMAVIWIFDYIASSSGVPLPSLPRKRSTSAVSKPVSATSKFRLTRPCRTCEKIRIPFAVLREPVVGDHQGLLLSFGKAFQADNGNGSPSR